MPPATLQTTVALVLGLCKGLSVVEAMKVINAIRALGMPSKAEVGFGKVITCPLSPNAPLAVVQPQECSKVVADSFTRYEYELFSGNVVSCKSEALGGGDHGEALTHLRRHGRGFGADAEGARRAVGRTHNELVHGAHGTWESKRAALESAGVEVFATLNDMVKGVVAKLG